jgi:hypothetical protein
MEEDYPENKGIEQAYDQTLMMGSDLKLEERTIQKCDAEIPPKPKNPVIFRGNVGEDKLKEIARDMAMGKIFCDRHIPINQPQLFSQIFMTFLFLDIGPETGESMLDIGLVYEYLDKAGPRSVNGFPIFHSCAVLLTDDAKKMWEYYEKYRTAIDAV